MSAEVNRPDLGDSPVTTDEYFGGCPKCGKTDGYVNNGRDHWFRCDTHMTCWYAGSNLFSSWLEPPTQADLAVLDRMETFSVVEPVYPERLAE